MKFFSLLALACTASVAFAAKSSPEPFEHYQSLAGTRSLDLNDDLYEELTGAPRDFHVAVLLTTLEARYGCELCQVFQPEWELVARSWAKGSQSTDIKLLLGTLEFKNGRRIFQKVRAHHCLRPVEFTKAHCEHSCNLKLLLLLSCSLPPSGHMRKTMACRIDSSSPGMHSFYSSCIDGPRLTPGRQRRKRPAVLRLAEPPPPRRTKTASDQTDQLRSHCLRDHAPYGTRHSGNCGLAVRDAHHTESETVGGS